jgi:glycine/D-amino acid oxidase-like deaminating enzyme/nitrite reductase/ring-hydroxylating ferredoxin subunit
MSEQRCSLWEESVEALRYRPLTNDVTVDVAVVGAGITGLTAALLLKRQGYRVAVLEAHHVGAGTTGATTAHLTAHCDRTFERLESAYGEAAARLVRESMSEAVDSIDGLVRDLGIDCDFQRVDGYYYAETQAGAGRVRAEFEAARRAGLGVAWTARVPLPFATALGFEVRDQARFHPLKYLNALSEAVDGELCRIYDATPVTGFVDGAPCSVTVANGCVVTARSVILATHVPLGTSALQATLSPYRSFVIAIETPDAPADALFWDDASPYHYIRTYAAAGTHLVLIGGEDRKTAHGSDQGAFEALEHFAHARFRVTRVVQRWAGQLYEPADSLPSIGKSPLTANTFVATGFSGDGLTLGTIAAHILAEQISGRETAYDRIFRPARLRVEGLKAFFQENFDVARSFVSGRFGRYPAAAQSRLAPGEGAVVSEGRAKVAVYRTDDGETRRFSAVCPHMKCIVQWNDQAKTFDCPCHGSRFEGAGAVLEGPALHGLSPWPEDRSLPGTGPAAPAAGPVEVPGSFP